MDIIHLLVGLIWFVITLSLFVEGGLLLEGYERTENNRLWYLGSIINILCFINIISLPILFYLLPH